MNTPSRLPRLLRVEDAAEILGVSTKTIQRWRQAGTLPCHKIGRLIRFSESELEAFIRNGSVGRLR